MTHVAFSKPVQPGATDVTRPALQRLLAPQSVAVVGASRKEQSVGHAVLRNIVEAGYTGRLFAVNPQADCVEGVRCYPGLRAIGEPVDLAIVAVPAPWVEAVVKDGADAGARNFLVISAGFKEAADGGAKREASLAALARRLNLHMIGPNCLGLINTDAAVRLNASFAPRMPAAGPISLISQSGALTTALLDYATGRNIGFSRVISFGNRVDVNETDLMLALDADPSTRCILLYLEDLADGTAFLEAATRITSGAGAKPIVVLKAGRTKSGAEAAASHTGALAGSDDLYDALFRQAGVIRAENVEQLFDLAEVFAHPSLPAGRRTAIITNAGGPGIIATDACVSRGLTIAHWNALTQSALAEIVPPGGQRHDPLDLIGDARHDRYAAAIAAVLADPGVDQVIAIVTPQKMTDVDAIAQVIGEATFGTSKPLIACLMGGPAVADGVQTLRARFGVPTYAFPEDAAAALAAKCEFAQRIYRPVDPLRSFVTDRERVTKVIDGALVHGAGKLLDAAAFNALHQYGFPLAPWELADTADDAARFASSLGYPVALKAAGPAIVHKSDIGGVRLKLRDDTAVRAAFDSIADDVNRHLGPHALSGVVVQKMAAPGREMIVGLTRDARLGPMVVVGLGGIYAEVFRDVSFAHAPIGPAAAEAMIRRLRCWPMLAGVRGEKPADVAALAEVLMRLGQLAVEQPLVRQVDLNPVIVGAVGEGVTIVDARIILGGGGACPASSH